jgi:hypothetical protein
MEVAAQLAISATIAMLLVGGYVLLRDVQQLNVRAMPRDIAILAAVMVSFGIYRIADGHGLVAISTFLTAAFLAFQAWFVGWYLRTRAPPHAPPD